MRRLSLSILITVILGLHSYSTAQTFTDVAVSAGVNNGAFGHGMGWGDYDNDGDPDLYVVNFGVANLLYRNNGNDTFTDVGGAAGVNDPNNGLGITWGDYDNDGDLDFYLAQTAASNRLYRNNGNGTFTDVAGNPGINMDINASGNMVAWGDFDNDGDLDLYLSHSGSTPNKLFQNDGISGFTDIAGNPGVNLDLTSQTSALGWADYNNDGYLDLYISNLTAGANWLFENNGNSTFTDVSVAAGVNHASASSSSVAWGDFDNDTDLDLYLANNVGTNVLYQNNGNSTFSNITVSAGVSDASSEGIGGAWADYDNDGDLDLYVDNNNGANILYQNQGTSTFSNVTGSTGTGDAGTGPGMGWADYDDDGDVDFYVVKATVNSLYRNSGNSNNWLKLNLAGPSGDKGGVGTKVIAVTGSTRQRRDVDASMGYLSQPSLTVEFGFGSTTTIDSLIIEPSTGGFNVLTNVSTNQTLSATASGLTVTIPDTTTQYGSTIDVPVRITNTSGFGIVASELSVTYRKDIVLSAVTTLSTTAGTVTTNSLVYQGWSVEENTFVGATVDTLAIAMSTAQDTLSGEGVLIFITMQVADIRHPDSTDLELVNVLFNDGSPFSTNIDGSLKITGTSGAIVATPDSIIPGDTVTLTVTDADFDLDVGSPDQVSATAISKLYNDSQTVILTETGNNTGIFTNTVNTIFSLSAGPPNDGVITTIAGDSICVSYVDSLTSVGTTLTRQDTVEVIGGADGVVQASYVVQALDGRNGVRDTVRVQITDADLDTDVGVAEQVSATITNAISGEVETVTLTETAVSSGIFQVRVPSIAGASGTNNNGELSLASWDTLNVSYTDALTAQGGSSALLDTTRVVNLFGDVRVNDQVQAFDAARLLAISVGLISSNTQTTLVGDVDGGGTIQAFDASLVLQYVVRLIDRFPVQLDFTDDPKNHPFEKPVPLDQIIALGELQAQSDDTYLLPIHLGEREGILSGTLTLGLDPGIEVLDVTPAMGYGSFMTAHNATAQDVRIAFAGSQSDLSGSGDVIILHLRSTGDAPIRLSLDQVALNGQLLTPTVNIEAIETVEAQAQTLVTDLYHNVPNPFNPQTTIRYDLSQAGQVNLVIYSITGQRIRTLVSEHQAVGSYQIVWDGKDAFGHNVGSGVYLMRLSTNSFVKTQKMLLLR